MHAVSRRRRSARRPEIYFAVVLTAALAFGGALITAMAVVSSGSITTSSVRALIR